MSIQRRASPRITLGLGIKLFTFGLTGCAQDSVSGVKHREPEGGASKPVVAPQRGEGVSSLPDAESGTSASKDCSRKLSGVFSRHKGGIAVRLPLGVYFANEQSQGQCEDGKCLGGLPIKRLALIDREPLPRCAPDEPSLEVSIYPGASEFPVDFRHRSYDEWVAACGADQFRSAPNHRLGERVAYEIADDKSFCLAEFRWGAESSFFERPTRELVFMRGRMLPEGKGVLNFVGLQYLVDEEDWPYVADMLRESARSLKVIW